MRYLLNLIGITLVLAGCSSATEPTAASGVPLASCTNTLKPSAFRFISQRGDTLPLTMNRFAVPRTNVDTVQSKPSPGGNMITFWYPHPDGYCVTLLDSIIHHDLTVVAYIPY